MGKTKPKLNQTKQKQENTMKFKSIKTKSLHNPDTKGILHQKSALFWSELFQELRSLHPCQAQIPANQNQGTNSSLWVLLMKTRASLNKSNFFGRLNQNPQVVCVNSPPSAEGHLVSVVIKGKWTQTLDQHWPWLLHSSGSPELEISL